MPDLRWYSNLAGKLRSRPVCRPACSTVVDRSKICSCCRKFNLTALSPVHDRSKIDFISLVKRVPADFETICFQIAINIFFYTLKFPLCMWYNTKTPYVCHKLRKLVAMCSIFLVHSTYLIQYHVQSLPGLIAYYSISVYIGVTKQILQKVTLLNFITFMTSCW